MKKTQLTILTLLSIFTLTASAFAETAPAPVKLHALKKHHRAHHKPAPAPKKAAPAEDASK